MKKLFITMILYWLVVGNAVADDDYRGDVSVPVDVSNTMTGGDVSVKGSNYNSFGLSNNMGDVDIAGCLGSVQFGSPVYSKQKLVINWPCMAEFYLRNAKYDLAAMALCNTEILDEFKSEAECEAAHDFGPMPVFEPVVVIDDGDEHQQEIDHLAEQLVALTEQVNKPRPVATRQYVQQPFLSDAKRTALAEVVKK